MPDASKPAVAALVRDLMFASKIRATAQSIGCSVRVLRDPAGLAELSARRLIVDLNEPGMLEAALEWKRRTGGEVVGFVSHVDTAVIEAAREGGMDQVLPRSRFVADLPRLLSE